MAQLNTRDKRYRMAMVAGLFGIAGVALIYQSFAANPNLPGDVNNDNVVNISDLSALLTAYGKTSTAADFNGDGKVTIIDLSVLLTNWGKTATTPNPPGPTPNPPTPPGPAPNMPSCGASSSSVGAASDDTIRVSNASAFSSALAAAGSGDVIELSGDYSAGLNISNKHVTGAPVTIKAAANTKMGAMTISDSSNITVMGTKYGPSNESVLLKIANATGVKVLRNTFDHKDISVNQSSIVITGPSKDITIACNEFRDKNLDDKNGTKITGSYIKFQYDGGDSIAKNTHIFKNYFKNITPFEVGGVVAGDSDREAIAMGIADAQNVVTNNTVEYNLFEDTDGENEIITVKTSKNTFRGNTFKNSMGSLSIRFGADTIVENNYFFGSGASAKPSDPNYQTGGIRTYGTRHILRNNFMKGLTGDVEPVAGRAWRVPFMIDNGDTSNSTGGDGHQTSTNLQITGNTVVDSAEGIHIGSNHYGNKPSGNTVTNNTVVGSKGTLFNDLATGGTWSGNKAYATGTAKAVGGTAKTSAQVQVLTAAPSINDPGPLTTSQVGPNAP